MTSGGDERMIDWMKYAEIQTLKRKGFKKARVAKMLNINRETVAKSKRRIRIMDLMLYRDKMVIVFDG